MDSYFTNRANGGLLIKKPAKLNYFCVYCGNGYWKPFPGLFEKYLSNKLNLIEISEDEFLKKKEKYEMQSVSSDFNLDDFFIIKHIPHSSLAFPLEERPLNDFDRYNFKMSDLFVDVLFSSVKGIEIKSDYSRLYVDVEKYKDDKKEIMSQYGQGMIYTKYFDGTPVQYEHGINRSKREKYYDTYHQNLAELVNKYIDQGTNILFLDCHSFSDEMASVLNKEPFPDVCIGINSDFNEFKLLSKIVHELMKRHLTYQINYPYSGSLVPNNLHKLKTNQKFISIMLEINKRLYL